ncbi:MAG: Rrf2 family transcriptional regulator [Planctomycetes bacterium]|nr:Rrf2 family transcriptional regulator [Planctomycetota bacterium]
MIKISRKADYAVLIMASLAERALTETGPQPTSAQEIADHSGLSRAVVANLLKALTRAGLLDSVRGANGGYHLAQPPGDISLAQILEAVEGPLQLVECAASLEPRPTDHRSTCNLFRTCPSRGAMRVVHDRVAGLMRQIRLPELLQLETRASFSDPTLRSLR